jgi:hypothetical protein
VAHIDEIYDQLAPEEIPSGGCLSFFAIPPMAVILIGIAFTITLLRIDVVPTDPNERQNSSEQSPINPSTNKENTKIAPLFTPEVHHWEQEISSWSQTWGLDPNLVATVMQIESCGDPHALSPAGAMGLFQVMPYHFSDGEDPFKPDVNAWRGLAYLKDALETRGGDVRLGLAGYNGGITGAKRPDSTWSAEMIRYTYWGTGIYNDALKGKAYSERLNEWLGRGGASLCAQAAKTLSLTK